MAVVLLVLLVLLLLLLLPLLPLLKLSPPLLLLASCTCHRRGELPCRVHRLIAYRVPAARRSALVAHLRGKGDKGTPRASAAALDTFTHARNARPCAAMLPQAVGPGRNVAAVPRTNLPHPCSHRRLVLGCGAVDASDLALSGERRGRRPLQLLACEVDALRGIHTSGSSMRHAPVGS